MVNDTYVGCLKLARQRIKGTPFKMAAAEDIGFGIAHGGTDTTVYNWGQSLNCE